MKSTILAVTILSLCFAVYPHGGTQSRPAPASQTPDSLCHCTRTSVPAGGISTIEEFEAKFGKPFLSEAERQLAWRVYQAANRCDAVMVIGRLSDTGAFENKPGYCVLR